MKHLPALALCASLLCASPAFASLVVSSGATTNVSCSGGTCTATAANAVLNVSDLQTMLATGNVSVASTSTASDIDIEASLSWASTNRLTLDAFGSVAFEMPVSVTGGGGLTITTNDGGTGGDFSFAPGATADFWDLTSSLVINATSYTLENDLGTLASDANANPSSFYALAKSIDATSSVTHSRARVPDFSGTLEGLGHAISNLHVKIRKNHRAALIALTESSALVRDLDIVSATMKGGDACALVGSNSGTIIQCSSSGSITAIGETGGLVGNSLNGYILRSHSSATVRATDPDGAAGGLVGSMDSGGGDSLIKGIFFSYATGTVTGADAGGLVGAWDDDHVSHSYATGTVSGTVDAGGLVGSAIGGIDNSFATGAVSGPDGTSAGGLAGYTFAASIQQSFATGNVKVGDSSSAGGFVGSGNFSASDSYAIGSVTGGVSADVGGFAGNGTQPSMSQVQRSYSAGSVKGKGGAIAGGFEGLSGHDGFGYHNGAAYWDIDTSGFGPRHGIGDCGESKCRRGLTGLTTSALKSGLPAGFDPSVWGESPSINNGYPYLLGNPPH